MNIVALVGQQRKLLLLALPMIFSNITTPLLGLVDTAVIGHLEHSYYLGGIAVGSMIISIIFWLCGFLRMSTTGVIAQSLGQGDDKLGWRYFIHSLTIALAISLLLLVLQLPLRELIFSLISASDEVTHYGEIYFNIRIYSAPAALINLVILGYLVASARIKWLIYQLLCVNIINIALDLLFVVGFEWGVAGAAYASVIADYCGLALLSTVLYPQLKQQDLAVLLKLDITMFRRLFSLNRDIFIRSIALQLCLAFITITGARLGDNVVAANAILLHIFLFASYGLDGFAYAAESMVGHAKGRRDIKEINRVVIAAAFWCGVLGVSFALALWLWGETWIGWLTNISAVKQLALQYLPWLVGVCVVSWLSFLMDGVYIGLTDTRAMRNSMLIACLVFFVLWFSIGEILEPNQLNHGVWLAFLGFIVTRGVTLSVKYYQNYQQGRLLD